MNELYFDTFLNYDEQTFDAFLCSIFYIIR
jgi:hypothetical protein